MTRRQAFLVVIDQDDQDPPVDAALLIAALSERSGGWAIRTVSVDALPADLSAELGGTSPGCADQNSP